MTGREVRQQFDMRLMIQIGTLLMGMAAVYFANVQRVALLEQALETKATELARMETAVDRLQAKVTQSSDQLIRLDVQLTDINRKLDRLLGYQTTK